ncbi:MAG: hypothetical protein AB7G11_02765 [Phycisphaerales bacterium]
MADETIRVVVETIGAANLRNMTEEVHRDARALTDLDIRLKQVAKSAGTASVAYLDLAEKHARLSAQIRASNAAMASNTAMAGMGAMGGTGSGGGKSGSDRSTLIGMTIMNVGAGIEDLQYGFRAVANQLPMLGMQLAQLTGKSLGAGMAIGGITAIISTLGIVSYNNFPKVKQLFDTIGAGARDWASYLTGGTVFDTASMAATRARTAEREEETSKAVAKLRTGKTPETIAVGQQFDEAVKQFSGERLAKAVGANDHTSDGRRRNAILARAMAGETSAIADVPKYMNNPEDRRAWMKAMFEASETGKVTEKNRQQARGEFIQEQSGGRDGFRPESTSATGKLKELADFRRLESEGYAKLVLHLRDLERQYNTGKITLTQFDERADDAGKGLVEIAKRSKELARTEKELREQAVQEASTRMQERESRRALGLAEEGPLTPGMVASAHQNRARGDFLTARDDAREALMERTHAIFNFGRAMAGPGARGAFYRQVLGNQERQVREGMRMDALLSDFTSAETPEERQKALDKVPAHLKRSFHMRANQFAQMQRLGLAPSMSALQAGRAMMTAEDKALTAAEKMNQAADKMLRWEPTL